MKEWADVFLGRIDDRLLVQRFALFYIPKALELMHNNNITRSQLSSFSSFVKDSKSAGKQAITKVSDCKPVVYESVVGFIRLFNAYCEHNNLDIRLSTEDIVACVFRFDDLNKTLNELNLTKESFQEQTQIPPVILESAIGGYRLQLSDCLKIWNIIKTSKKLGDGNIEDSILVTQKNSRNSIKKITDDDYVYRREFLTAAPQKGHPWSIDE